MEVHAELLTKSKMFCRCPVAFGGEPNTRVCPVCLGMPGSLPVPNRVAIEMVLRTALAMNCTIAMDSVFHRKNYFYPDLPKGYQVSQYGETNPIGYDGSIEVPHGSNATRTVRIRRVHLEEDTGKLMHLPDGRAGIDFNRAGVPLMEVVTEFPPDISSSDEARAYLVQLRKVLLYLGVCDGKMEQGSLRCEPNISIRPEGSDEYGTKTELKNLNSFRAVHLGVDYEVMRQTGVLEAGGTVAQETRGWNEQKEESFLMRVKEVEQEYRYFPCPDLVPMSFSEDQVESLRRELPELPLSKSQRFVNEFKLDADDAGRLTASLELGRFFDAAVEAGGDPKPVCNWMLSDFSRLLNESGQVARLDGADPDGREVSKVRPTHLVELTSLIADGTISGKIGKEVFEEVFATGSGPAAIVAEKGLKQITDDSFIEKLAKDVIEAHPDQVTMYRNGKTGILGFLVGQAMKKSQGKANPQKVQEQLRRILDS